MIRTKIIYLVLILFTVSCSKGKKNSEKENFDIYKFLLNYKISEKLNDSLIRNKLVHDLDYKDSMTTPGPRYIVDDYGNIFNNSHKYLILKDQGIGDSYIWFKKTKNGFVKFFERDNTDALYIKDTIYDTNNDSTNELVIYKHRGGSGPDYKIIYFLSNDGLIRSELNVDLKERIRN